MGLKFSDALRLSWSNIAQHKKRSVLIIATVSVLFALIIGLNLVFQGVENTILDVVIQASGGKIYVETGFEPAYRGVSNPSSYLPGNADEIVRKRLERYHGEYAGKVTEYEFEIVKAGESGQYGEVVTYTPDYYRVINYGAVADFCDSKLTEVPKGKIPVLLMKGAGLSKEEQETFYGVGELPFRDQMSLALPGGFNPLNLALGESGGQSHADFTRNFLMVDDGESGLIEKFIAERTAEMWRQYEEVKNPTRREVGVVERPVATFARVRDFARYYSQTAADGREYGYICDYSQSYFCATRDLFGNAASVASGFMRAEYLLQLVGAFLLVIAACIAAITFSHIIDEDAATIALYRSMGASTNSVYLVYFCYLIELGLMAIATCFLVSFIFAGLMMLTSVGALGDVLMRAYNLAEVPAISMVGFNAQIGWAVVAILLVAPLALLMTWRRFSPKHIAKKLKDD